MKKILTRYRTYTALSFACCISMLISCSDWDEFKKYTEAGEIIYPGKFDSLAVYPGDHRVRIWGTLTADPRVTTAKVFWNNDQDSAEFQIEDPGSDYIFDQMIEVNEGATSFTLYTFDDQGHKSVASTVTGIAYGDRYRNTLYNRKVKSVAYDDAATTIFWDIIDPKLGPEAMEVTYISNGVETTVSTPASEGTTVLTGLDFTNDGFTWRTIYRPLPGSNGLTPIDTFSTGFASRAVPTFAEEELDRSLFAEAFYNGDTFGNGGAGGIDAMWDERPQNDYGGTNFTDINSAWSSPQMITFDLGLKVDVTQIKIYPFLEWWGSYYVFSTIRDYEIYGSAAPNPDGSLDESWTLLASGTFEKPSGLGKDQEDDADRALAIAGFPVTVDPAAERVRYIRIRCLKNYEGYWQNSNAGFFSINEIRVYGMLPQ